MSCNEVSQDFTSSAAFNTFVCCSWQLIMGNSLRKTTVSLYLSSDATWHYQSLFASNTVLAFTFNNLRKLVEKCLAKSL